MNSRQRLPKRSRRDINNSPCVCDRLISYCGWYRVTDNTLQVIHPDKATHPKAQDAFDLLKKVRHHSACRTPLIPSQAESDLSDKDKRENIDGTVTQARYELLRSMGLATSTQEDSVKLKDLTPPWKEQVKAKVKALLIEEELRRRRYV